MIRAVKIAALASVLFVGACGSDTGATEEAVYPEGAVIIVPDEGPDPADRKRGAFEEWLVGTLGQLPPTEQEEICDLFADWRGSDREKGADQALMLTVEYYYHTDDLFFGDGPMKGVSWDNAIAGRVGSDYIAENC
jgi:hypothetical protein